ncbi:helix-turn-helix transcriptional regulator [Flavobacterium sp. MK4S-17]|uniref:helix-turn-helix domain-containing protein n=1 Tax=Flavobacterium sp. MK4S-17 TaxID=2543737 RepID=UPI00135A5EA4|nr:helix-turn-helix transcriptional regulator [Flavobacterium sp. MK4S-17]
MINTEGFIKRLEKILEYYAISASGFADKIGIQRSGLSHILSGRNKPSLDLVMKITENFKDVNLYWLLYGEGAFPAHEEIPSPITPTPALKENSDKTEKVTESLLKQQEQKINNDATQGKDIDRIVIFFSDGTFKNYIP